MKTFRKLLGALLLLVPVSCAELLGGQEKSYITVSFTRFTKAGDGAPDPGSFLLSVVDASGGVVYRGPFSESPEKIEVSAGSYTVQAVSCEFSEPKYDSPQYGDTKVVNVPAGGCVGVTLECAQLNSGLRVVPDATFRTEFPDGSIYLKGNGGSLMYSYTEHRTAFFAPGVVTLTLKDSGKEQALCSRMLEAQEMLTMKLSACPQSGSGSGRVMVQVDTTRKWTEDSWTVGGSSEPEYAYSVVEARNHIGDTIWVEGYVVGVASGTSSFNFTPPFSKDSNIILGLRSTTTDKEYCLSVELPKGAIRETLNLCDNPGLLGCRVLVRGTIATAYFGIPGLKSPTDFRK